MESIEQRLYVLERELRRSQRVNRILLLTFVAVGCVASAQGIVPAMSKPMPAEQSPAEDEQPADHGHAPHRLRTVEADRFVLLDRLGRPRITMEVRDSGPAIAMLDEAGKQRLELSHSAKATGLSLFDSGKSPIVSLQLPRNVKNAGLKIRTPQGSTRATASGFSVWDANRKQRLLLALINGNSPVLLISESREQGSIEMTARSLTLHNADRFPLFFLSSHDGGSASLNFRHPDHDRSVYISGGLNNHDGPLIGFSAPVNEDGTGGILPYLRLGLDKHGKPFMRTAQGEGQPFTDVLAE